MTVFLLTENADAFTYVLSVHSTLDGAKSSAVAKGLPADAVWVEETSEWWSPRLSSGVSTSRYDIQRYEVQP